MSSNFNLSSFDPALRQKILSKLQDVKPVDGEDLSEQEIEDIAKDVVKEENDNTTGTKKLNMNRILSAMELGLSLNTEKMHNFLGTKGVSDAAYVYPMNTDFLYSLMQMGIIGLDDNKKMITDSDGFPKILDKQAATNITGKPVTTFMELYKAIKDDSYSFEEDISPLISEDYINELMGYGWIVGPLEEYATEEDFDSENVTGYRYALNKGAIDSDFAQYLAQGNKIETIEDLVKALDWATANGHAVNGQIDEGVYQGGTGDCWLLSAILALNATEEGQQVIRDSLQVNSDGSVAVTFKGIKTADGEPVQYTISADEIKAHDTDYNSNDMYSNGDNDMLVMELAVEKLEKDIYLQSQRQMNSIGKEILLPNESFIKDTKPGMEDVVDENGNVVDKTYIQGGASERLLYFLTGNAPEVLYPEGYEELVDKLYDEGMGSYIDPILGNTDGVKFSGLSEEQIFALLESCAENPKAMTFGVHPDPDSFLKNNDGSYYVEQDENGNYYLITYRVIEDVNGKVFKLPLPFSHVLFDKEGNPQLDENGNLKFTKGSDADPYTGHALVITGVDQENRTVTIANPWDSTDEYTLTWEQFQQMGIFTVTVTNIGTTSTDSVETSNKQEPTDADNSDLPFADIMNAIPEENKILADDIKELLTNALNNQDIDSLFDLTLYGFNVEDAVLQKDGTFNVTVSLNGVNYTFTFEAEKEDELIEAGLLIADNTVNTRGAVGENKTSSIDSRSINDEFTLEDMQEFIGSNSTIWSYLIAIPPKNGGTIPTFKVNTASVKSRFPEQNIRTMQDLKDTILNINSHRAGTRGEQKPKPEPLFIREPSKY